MQKSKQATGLFGGSATPDALWCIAGVSVLGLFASATYGDSFSFKGAILAVLASVLGYATGGLVGFLFGFPRYTENAAVATVDDLKKAIAKGQTGAAVVTPTGLNANTNLERIVDWLMTIIVGATLVNIRDIVDWGRTFFQLLAQAVQEDTTVSNAVPGALLVLPFMVGGFLHLYLWARRYLPGEWSAAEQDLKRVVEQVQEIEETVTQRVKVVENDVTRIKQRVWPVGPSVLERISKSLKSAGVESGLIDDILMRYRGADEWDSEPFEGFAGPASGAFELSAEGKQSELKHRFELKLFVKRKDGGASDYEVGFLLHNTFDEPYEMVTGADAANGYTVWCDEDFIVGALVIEKTQGSAGTTVTKLSLNLASLPVFKKDQ